MAEEVYSSRRKPAVVSGGPYIAAALCRALGIDPDTVPVQKIVIECGVDDVVRVYVKALGSVEMIRRSLPHLRTLVVEEVKVTDDATVVCQEK
jgi:hypothetical protein